MFFRKGAGSNLLNKTQNAPAWPFTNYLFMNNTSTSSPLVLMNGPTKELVDFIRNANMEDAPAEFVWWPQGRASVSRLEKNFPQAKRIKNNTYYLHAFRPSFPVTKMYGKQFSDRNIKAAIENFPDTWITQTLQWEQSLAKQQGREVDNKKYLLAALYLAGAVETLSREKPDLMLVWGGARMGEAARVVVAGSYGIPVFYAERGVFSRSVFLANGPTGPTLMRQESNDTRESYFNTKEQQNSSPFIEEYLSNDQSAWGQPSREDIQILRQRWGIPDTSRIIFYAAQRPEDANTVLYSPHFASNGACIKHVIAAMRGLKDIALVVKPHPKEPPETDQEILNVLDVARQGGLMAVFDRNVNVKAAINAAAVVVSINSTTGFEALLHKVPVVVGGEAHYSHRGFTFDIQGSGDAEIARLGAFLEKPQYSLTQQDAFSQFFQRLNREHLFYCEPMSGQNGPHEFISVLVQAALQKRSLPKTVPQVLEDITHHSNALLRQYAILNPHRNQFTRLKYHILRAIQERQA